MPKYLSPIERANESIERAIREGMARKGIQNITSLAEKIKVPKSTLYDHIKTPLDYPMKTLYLISVAIGTPLCEILKGVKI